MRFTEDDRARIYSYCTILFIVGIIGLEELVAVSEKTMGLKHSEVTRILHEGKRLLDRFELCRGRRSSVSKKAGPS
jgi:hypothetical protein